MIRQARQTQQAEAKADVTWDSPDEMRLSLSGRLTASSLPEVWSTSRDPVAERRPRRVRVDGAGIQYCDGAGMGLFIELRRAVALVGGEIEFAGLSPELQRLLAAATLSDPKAPVLEPVRQPNVAVRTGMTVAAFFREMKQSIAFVGEMTVALVMTAIHPGRIRGRDLWVTAEKVGANAVPVVCLLGGLIGLIMAYQTAPSMQRYGATSLIPTLVSIALVRELGPFITAIIVAGRSGAAFAAEIGTMKVTEELDALRTFGMAPVTFLAVPRVLAAMLMMPLLTVFADLVGIAAGYIVMANYGYTVAFYKNAVVNSLTYQDFLGGTGKTLAFGLIIGAIGCMRGMRTRLGPSAVGDSTTKAVVSSIVLIIAVDMLFGVVYYYLGI